MAYRNKALASLDRVLGAADRDLYRLVCDLLLAGCHAAAKPPPPQVLQPLQVLGARHHLRYHSSITHYSCS